MNTDVETPHRPATITPDAIQAITDWLIEEGLAGTSFEAILAGFCERLMDVGVPLQRCMIGMRTLHPSVDAVTFIWRRGRDVISTAFGVDQDGDQDWRASPLRHMLDNNLLELRRRLDGPDAQVDFPVLADFRDEGATDYYVRVVRFAIGREQEFDNGLTCSWTTDRADGFLGDDIAILDRIVTRLTLTAKSRLTMDIAENVLDTYVGPDAGHRIMGGDIRRGSLDVKRAVLFYADLRGFTAVTDTLDRGALPELLDAYFEHMVPPLLAHGGQVLKYLGDGFLATFNLEDVPRDSVCSDSLQAAYEAILRVRELNASRAAAGKPVMELDIALHLGDVLYGNVGAADRLDFTVIGPAVNEASRIETLCAQLGHNVLISQAFAEATVSCTDRLISVGRQTLRGVRDAQEIYTIDTSA